MKLKMKLLLLVTVLSTLGTSCGASFAIFKYKFNSCKNTSKLLNEFYEDEQYSLKLLKTTRVFNGCESFKKYIFLEKKSGGILNLYLDLNEKCELIVISDRVGNFNKELIDTHYEYIKNFESFADNKIAKLDLGTVQASALYEGAGSESDELKQWCTEYPKSMEALKWRNIK